MPVYGVMVNRKNPEFTKEQMLIFLPQYKKFFQTEEGEKYFEALYKIANSKIFYYIYGPDWPYAMSLCIAHYLTLISNQLGAPSGSSLTEIAGGGNFKGVMSSASVGGFNKTYDLDKTMSSKEENLFWNQTSFGASLMALLASKSIPSIAVIASPLTPYGHYKPTFPPHRFPHGVNPKMFIGYDKGEDDNG